MLRPRQTGETVHSDDDWFVRRDGSMFPIAWWSALETGGTGLKGTADRATALGGRLTISSPARRGACVGAAFPVAATPSQTSAWYGQQ
jgi:glucose-6-phosphate-specific signal transduction histidine kinase